MEFYFAKQALHMFLWKLLSRYIEMQAPDNDKQTLPQRVQMVLFNAKGF